MQSSSPIAVKTRAVSRDKHYWREMINVFNASNEKPHDFCARRDINVGTFIHWRGVFKKENAHAQTKFIEVKLPAPEKNTHYFSVKCPSGHTILCENTSNEAVKNILQLLGVIA